MTFKVKSGGQTGELCQFDHLALAQYLASIVNVFTSTSYSRDLLFLFLASYSTTSSLYVTCPRVARGKL